MRLVTRRQWVGVAGCLLGGATVGTRRDARPTGPASVAPEAMVLVPEGPFLMGTSAEEAARLARRYGPHPAWLSGELPRRAVSVAAFAIDRCPVTNRQYARFCAETGHARPRHWGADSPPEALDDHPVVGVSQPDALAYAAWAGKRLPTEAEWEKAARGTEGRTFPWGEEFQPEACRFGQAGSRWQRATSPVTAHPAGASPYGVLDLVGNASEWCADGPGPACATLKGGSWMNHEVANLRPAARSVSGWATGAALFYGFRCARDAAATMPT